MELFNTEIIRIRKEEEELLVNVINVLIVSLAINITFAIWSINISYKLKKYYRAVDCYTNSEKVKGVVKNKYKEGLYYTYVQIVGTGKVISVTNIENFMAYSVGEEIDLTKYTVIDKKTGKEIETYYDIQEVNKEISGGN